MTGRCAVFLDRDGVLNELVADPATGLPESPLRWQDVRITDGAVAAIRELRGANFAVACVSNQPAAAKGFVSEESIRKVHDRVMSDLDAAGAGLDASRLCLHHPEGVVPGLSLVCPCRKPAPGMLLSIADELGVDLERSWVIGDTDSDVTAGRAAGCRTILIEHPPSRHKRTGLIEPDRRASDILEAAAIVVGSSDCS